ncbi:MAG: AhpC/TSA family protein [Bacteroidales bacterium]|nr:AhpC/TSA family protein [Bacteroidales bacterium]
MKKNVVVLACMVLLLTAACNPASKVKVEGNYIPDTKLEVRRLNLSHLVTVDSVFTDRKGNFSFSLPAKKGFPEFYYIVQDEKPLSSLLLLAGDRVSVAIDQTTGHVEVKGSAETAYLHEAEAAMKLSQHRYDSLMQHFLSSNPGSAEAVALNYALGDVYVKQKQGAIRFIFNRPRSMASVQVLFQQFSDELPVFADFKDAIFFQHVYDSLRQFYPRSPYVAALREQAEFKRKQMELNDHLLNAKELGFPDISLPNIQAEPVALSLLKGKVILLSFWLSQDPRQRMANQDLLELYRRYAPVLEIYQVALDTDKAAWARTITEQQLPWVSVCDGYGLGSGAVATYAVSQLPANFLIDKNGDIVGRDLFGEELASALARLCRL